MAEITLLNPQTLLALPLLGLLLAVFAARRRFRPLGAFLLRLALVALATLALARPVRLTPEATASDGGQERLVVLVDQSANLGEAGQRLLRVEAERLSRAVPDSAVLFFADRPVLVAGPLSPSGEEVVEQLPLNPEISDLAGALSMGARLLNGQPGRLILLSDGLPTAGDTTGVTAQLAQQGVPVDVLIPEGGETQNEVRVVDLDVPPRLRQGETFAVEITLHSLFSAGATLSLLQDGALLAQDVVSLEPGPNLFAFEANAGEIGLRTFQASVTLPVAADGQPANNSLAAFTQVYAPPQILIVSETSLPADLFSAQLQEAGFVLLRASPAELPSRLSELEPFAGMVLLDVPARVLELEQMLAVQEFVRSLGRGLLVTGGRNSFSLGQYEDTPLAELLPVSLEPPPREERPPVALLLIVDHSGSMAATGEPTKLVMAKEAAIRATDVLGPDDVIGVLMFDDDYEWIVPFQMVGDGATFLDIQHKIATIPHGGGTHMLQALEAGLTALAQQTFAGGARHAVLLTDGISHPGTQQDYEALVDAALLADITLSTIAIGSDADQVLLAHLAERGLGRYHFTAVPEELPDLTIAESAILSSDALQEGTFRPATFMPHPLLRGLFTVVEGAPLLRGYIAMTPRPRAEMVLQIGPGDPLLSVWGYGLGRVAAWASDTGEEWATSWRSWPQAGRFWGQLLGYTLPAPDLGSLQLKTELAPDGVVTLTAEGTTSTGQTVDLARTRATLTTPAGQSVSLNLLQVAPGRYQQRLRLPDPGAYGLDVTQSRAGEPDETASTGFVVPYPAEYGLPAGDAGEALLKQIAEATGGRVLTAGEPLLPNSDPGDLVTPPKPLELWPWLLLAALLLWPLEIAWRRWRRLRFQ